MKRNTLLTSAILIFLSAFPVAAQPGEYILEIKAGKRILNAESLELAPTAKLEDLLALFPELLAREGDLRLANYDLQVDDVSMGDSKDIILEQLTLSHISKIEVSQTPSASQQKNGQGGTINVILRPLQEGLTGEVTFSAGSRAYVTPGTRINYRKGAWSVKGLVVMDYYHPLNETSIREKRSSDVIKYQSDTSAIDNGYEFVNIDVLFAPDKHNKLHLWGWESLSLNSNLSKSEVEVNSVCTDEEYLQKDTDFGWLVGANYLYTFVKSQIEAECTYSNMPTSCKYDKYTILGDESINTLDYSDKISKSNLTGLLKYKYNFVPESPESKALLTGGVNCNLATNTLSYDYDRRIPHIGLHGSSSLLYISPYIESDNIFGKWFLKGSIRYMHYSHNMDAKEGEPYARYENYLTGFLSVGYQLAPHHHLSLIMDRSVKRGDEKQIYPYKVYDPSIETFSIGNASLVPVCTNSISANYITDFKAGENNITFDLELKYMNNTDIISSYYTEDDVLTYSNDGNSNIAAANFLFHLSGKVFAISFTANAFNNYTHIKGVDDHYLYYNLSAVPTLNFKGGWVISAQMTYNSHVYTRTTKLSDYIYVNTRFSKSWDKWTMYLELDDNFHNTAEDKIYGDTVYEMYWYNLHRPSFTAGVHFRF